MKKRTLKRAAALLMAGTVAFTGLQGLGAQNVFAKGSDDVVLNFYYWDENQKEGMDAMIQLFEESHEGIKVESTVIPWTEYFTKLQTSLPNGTGPDVFWMNLYAEPYFDSGLLYDMTDRIKEDQVDMSKYPQGVLEAYTQGDKYFGIPKDYDGYAIYYNKAIFDELGVDYPKEGWTWDEFRETAKALTNDEYYGYAAESSMEGYRQFLLSNGGKFVSDDGTKACYNQKEDVETFQFLHDLMYVDKVSPSAQEMIEIEAGDMFVNGMVAMVPGGSYQLSKYKNALGEDLGIMEFPVNKEKGCSTAGLAYCMSAKGSNIDAAWEFCRFAATKEAQDAAVSSAIPANEDSKQAWLDYYKDQEDVHYLIDYVDDAISNPIYANGKTAECEIICSDAINEVWMDENADIQSAMDKCVADIEAVINEK